METLQWVKCFLWKHVKTWVWMPTIWRKPDLIVYVCNPSERRWRQENSRKLTWFTQQWKEGILFQSRVEDENQDTRLSLDFSPCDTCSHSLTHTNIYFAYNTYIHIQIHILNWSLLWKSISHTMLLQKALLSSCRSHFYLKANIPPKKVGYIFRFDVLIKMTGKKWGKLRTYCNIASSSIENNFKYQNFKITYSLNELS